MSLFHANQRSGFVGSSGDELAFQFGSWLAVVEAPRSATAQAEWAANLSGTVDADGYLVLHASPPLTVDHVFEGGFGVVPSNSLELASNLYCDQPESDTSTRRRQTNGDGSEFVSWCEGTLHVTAEGSTEFVDHAEHDLQITRPGTPVSSPAASASFISPDTGWVLEQNGTVAETTDGGRTWAPSGHVGSSDSPERRVRFADADHGFVFDQRRLFADA